MRTLVTQMARLRPVRYEARWRADYPAAMGVSHCGVCLVLACSLASNLCRKHSNDPERHRVNNHDFIVVDEYPVPAEPWVDAHHVFRNGGQPHTSRNHGVHTDVRV